MSIEEVIKKRLSIRKYDSRPIKREDIRSCLAAAQLAPSACNAQPWEFIIVDTPAIRDTLCDAILSGIYGLNSFIRDAPVLVVVVADEKKWFVKVCDFVRSTKLCLIDLGIACEHFVLRAAELGIGTCYLGWFNERKVKKILKIARTKRVHLVISMGYSLNNDTPQPKPRKELCEISRFL
ncbi:MAG: NAD(P)H nitroreductase [Candidatus Omnitrophica bacterium]|nr:NAD(P)H nitroreductase [Candidatus Omnitrophota bacterium]